MSEPPLPGYGPEDHQTDRWAHSTERALTRRQGGRRHGPRRQGAKAEHSEAHTRDPLGMNFASALAGLDQRSQSSRQNGRGAERGKDREYGEGGSSAREGHE